MVREINPRLVAFARRKLRCQATVDDVVSETWACAFASARTFGYRANAYCWLLTILKRRIVDHYRRKSRREFEEITEAIPDSATDLEGRFIAAQSLEAIQTVHLSKSERTIVQKLIDGHDRVEIQQQMKITNTNYRVRLCEARKKLIEAL